MASPQLNFAQGVEPANTFWREDRFHGPYPLRAADPRFQEILAKLAADPGYKAFVVTSFTVSHWLYSDKYLEDFCRAHAAECRGLSAAEIEDAKAILNKHKIGLVYAFDATIAKIGLTPERLDAMIRYVELLYKSNIFQLDRFFGEVIDEIDRRGATDESLVVFTADHGEIPYRPTVPLKWTHGYFLTADDIPVPMILRGRGIPPGRYDGVTRSIDVFPTLAALSGFALAKDAVMGADLADAVRGKSAPPPLVALLSQLAHPARPRLVPRGQPPLSEARSERHLGRGARGRPGLQIDQPERRDVRASRLRLGHRPHRAAGSLRSRRRASRRDGAPAGAVQVAPGRRLRVLAGEGRGTPADRARGGDAAQPRLRGVAAGGFARSAFDLSPAA